MLSLGLRGGKPQCCLQLPISLVGLPKVAVQFSAKLSWAACSGTGDATMGGSDLYLTRGGREYFSLRTCWLLAHLDQKSTEPRFSLLEPITGGTQPVLPATPAFTAPAPAWAPSLPALALPGQALLPVPSQHSPPHLAPLHACCTAPAPLLDPIPQPSPPHSIPATEPLPTLLDPRHSLAHPTSCHSTPQPCLTPLDPCY